MGNKTLTKVPISEATKVPKLDGFYNLIANRYWAVTDDDCLLFNGTSPQCNSNESIVQRFAVRYAATKVVFIEAVWIPHDCNDYL